MNFKFIGLIIVGFVLPAAAASKSLEDYLKARRLDGHYASPDTSEDERRMLEHAHTLSEDPATIPAYRQMLDDFLKDYWKGKEEALRRDRKAASSAGRPGVSAFPNPSRGREVVIRAETASADELTVTIHALRGDRVAADLVRRAPVLSGAVWMHEFVWTASRLPSEIYVYRVANTAGGLVGEGKVAVTK